MLQITNTSPTDIYDQWVTSARKCGFEPTLTEMTAFLPLISESLITFTLLQKEYNEPTT